jgi:5'-3' exonuclease
VNGNGLEVISAAASSSAKTFRTSPFQALLVDAHNVAVAAWWPCRDRMTRDGVPNGLEFGFLWKILKLAREFAPARLILCWDGDYSRRCRELWSEYKRTDAGAAKSRPDWDAGRLAGLRALLAPLVVSCYDRETEADEQIAALVARLGGEPGCIGIVSSDKDFHQLVSERVWVLSSGRTVLGPVQVRDRWGLEPTALPLFRALDGDRADGLERVGGVHTTTKKRLVLEYGGDPVVVRRAIDADPSLTAKERERLRFSWSRVETNFEIMDLRDRAGWTPTFLSDVFWASPTGTFDSGPLRRFCDLYDLGGVAEAREWRLFADHPPKWLRRLVAGVAVSSGIVGGVGAC